MVGEKSHGRAIVLTPADAHKHNQDIELSGHCEQTPDKPFRTADSGCTLVRHPNQAPAMDEVLQCLRQALADRYTIEKEIGRGGMSVVFLARDLKNQRNVALKVLHPELAKSIGAKRFIQEIKIAANLEHPNIMPLFDSGSANGLLYYTMPFVEGESLRDRLKREGSLALQDALQVAKQVGEALAYAHEHGVVHRDIKPENILLAHGISRVADFGIARARTEAGDYRSVTDANIAVGTPEYMSPEQAGGAETLDGRTDIYSLGCVLYEMFAGEPPFTGRTLQAIIAKHLGEKVPTLTVVRPGIPLKVVRVVEKALAKVPADRYTNATKFVEALEEPGSFWFPKALFVGAALVALTSGAYLAYDSWPTAEDGPDELNPNHVAVLELEDRSPSGDCGWLTAGLTDELILALSDANAITVRPYLAVAPYNNRNLSPQELGRTLRAGTLVHGYVNPIGGDYRVTVNLIDSETGSLLGDAVRISAPVERTDSLLTGMVESVARALRQGLGQHVTMARWQAETRNADAWVLVRRADEYARNAEQARLVGDLDYGFEILAKADSMLAEAEQISGGWPEPTRHRGWITLQFAKHVSSALIQRHGRLPSDPGDSTEYGRSATWIRRGLDHAARAAGRDERDPRTLELRGALLYHLRDHVSPLDADSLLGAASADLLAATMLDPSLTRAWIYLALVYKDRGLFREAAEATETAYHTDAYAAEDLRNLTDRFFAALYQARFMEANVLCNRGQVRYPNDHTFRQCGLWVLGWSGNSERAVADAWTTLRSIEASDSAGVLADTWGYRRVMVAAVLARAGLRDSACSVVRAVRDDTAKVDVNLDFQEAYVYVLLGETDTAVALLDRFLRERPGDHEYVKGHPWFQSIRSEESFLAVVGRDRTGG